MIEQFQQRQRDWKLSSTADRSVRVYHGLVLSANILMRSAELRDQLRQQWPDAIGGEMEGAGLYGGNSQCPPVF